MSLGQRFRRARRRLMFVSLRRLLRATGLKQARTIGNWLGDLQFHVARQRRLRLQGDVAAALGRSTDDPGVPALLREAYRVNNGAVLEIVSMFDHRHDEDELASMCELDGLEHLRAAMTAGRGAILLATHMGNAALVPVRLAKAGWSVSVVYREARMMTAGFLQTGFELYGIQGILANAGIRAYAQMLSALKQGRVVFVMLDQGVKRAEDGQMQRFLGKNTAMPAGPAQLARASRAPVLPLVTTAATPKWKFSIEPPVPLGQGSIESDVLTLVALTERQILQAPQLWSWHHRRWRHLPRAAALPSSPGAGD